MEHIELESFNKELKEILEKIANLSTEDSEIEKKALDVINEIKIKSNNGDIPQLCYNCKYCLDFDILFKALFNYLFKREDYDSRYIKQLLHEFNRAAIDDEIIDKMEYPKLTQEDFGIKIIERDKLKKTKLYFDLNVINHFYMENEQMRELINKVKDLGILFVYSPAHLCEFVNMSDENMQRKRIQAIRELTECIEVLPEGNRLKLVIEDPIYPLNRINKNPDFNHCLEELKLISDDDRNTYFEVYNNILHKRAINNDPVLEKYESKINDILCFRGYRTLNYMKNAYEDSNNLDLQQIENDIKGLYYVFDILCYQRDKEENKIKSSIYDIEHLTYAWCCEIFVTNDNKCYERAKIIYEFLGLKTKVIKADKDLKVTLNKVLKDKI